MVSFDNIPSELTKLPDIHKHKDIIQDFHKESWVIPEVDESMKKLASPTPNKFQLMIPKLKNKELREHLKHSARSFLMKNNVIRVKIHHK